MRQRRPPHRSEHESHQSDGLETNFRGPRNFFGVTPSLFMKAWQYEKLGRPSFLPLAGEIPPHFAGELKLARASRLPVCSRQCTGGWFCLARSHSYCEAMADPGTATDRATFLPLLRPPWLSVEGG